MASPGSWASPGPGSSLPRRSAAGGGSQGIMSPSQSVPDGRNELLDLLLQQGAEEEAAEEEVGDSGSESSDDDVRVLAGKGCGSGPLCLDTAVERAVQ